MDIINAPSDGGSARGGADVALNEEAVKHHERNDMEAQEILLPEKLEDLSLELEQKLNISSKEVRSELSKAADNLDAVLERLKHKLSEELCSFKGIPGYKEVERYWVNEPYSFVVILYNEDKNDYLYYVVEPELSPLEKFLLAEIKSKVKSALLFTKIEGADKEEILKNKIDEVLRDYGIELDNKTYRKIVYYIIRDFLRFGKIDVLMNDPYVEDISCDGWDTPVFIYHWEYGNIRTNIKFSRRELDSFVIKLAQRGGKHISTSDPMVDVALEDGSRAQLTLGMDVTTRGSTFTIRRFREILITPVDLIRWKTFSLESMVYLWICAENNKSMLFVGGTASGKTTSLNAVALFIPINAKVVTIEDTREVKLPHPNWIPAVTRDVFMAQERGKIDMYDLLKAALRQRPEYIIVGEVRGREAQTLFQAMSTGHTTFSTFHADSVDAAIHRLEYPPLSVPRSMIEALDVVSVQAQTFVGGRRVRRNLEIVEILEIDPTTRNIKTQTVFSWDPLTDSFSFMLPSLSASKCLRDIARFRAWTEERLEEEFRRRKALLEYMVKTGVSPEEFISVVHSYHAKPEKTLRRLKIEW